MRPAVVDTERGPPPPRPPRACHGPVCQSGAVQRRATAGADPQALELVARVPCRSHARRAALRQGFGQQCCPHVEHCIDVHGQPQHYAWRCWWPVDAACRQARGYASLEARRGAQAQHAHEQGQLARCREPHRLRCTLAFAQPSQVDRDGRGVCALTLQAPIAGRGYYHAARG